MPLIPRSFAEFRWTNIIVDESVTKSLLVADRKQLALGMNLCHVKRPPISRLGDITNTGQWEDTRAAVMEIDGDELSQCMTGAGFLRQLFYGYTVRERDESECSIFYVKGG